MILFKTRNELKQLREQIQILERNLDRFFNTYNGTVKLVDEVTKLMHQHSAEVRENTSNTFKLEDLKPDYGDNWDAETAKLNKKGNK